MATYVIKVVRGAGIAALFIIAAMLGILSGVLFAYAGDLPQISALDDYTPSTITRVTASNGQVVGEFATQRRVVVGYDGTVYVVWEGATRLATLDGTWMAKSTDGGATFSRPVEIAPLQDIISPANTVFRVNSFPAADVAPNGDLYVAWSSQQSNSSGLCPSRTNTGCHFRISALGPTVQVIPPGSAV